MQRPNQRWRFTGIAARLAEPKKIVTNRSSGGTIIPYEEAMMQCGIETGPIDEVRKLITQLSLESATILTGRYHGLRELGIDIGLDQELFPWILEVNTRPVIKLFGQLPDKTMYNRILNYHREIWQYKGKRGGKRG